MAPFDPYHNWLGIPPHEQPANFYRLLGLVLFESNPNVIAQAADRQSMHVGSFQNGPSGEYCHQLMGEIGQATACLLDPQQKAAYDHHLQDILSARGERSVMAAPPPPGGMPLAGFASSNFGDMNAFGQPQQGTWSNGSGPQGEMPMPQFSLPPAMGSSPAMGPAMPDPMGFQPNGMANGGMTQPGPMNSPMVNQQSAHVHQPMQSFLQGPPAPMTAPLMMPSAQPMQQPQAPRMPAPAPFPKAQRPMPVANRVAGAPAPASAASSAAAAAIQAAPPQPPPAAPPRPANELEEIAATPTRRRFMRRKKNEMPMELVMGGIGVVVVIAGFVIYAALNNNVEQHGLDGLATSIPATTTTTAADAAAADLKKVAATKDSANKAEAAKANDKKSRAVTTTAPNRPKHKPPKAASAATSDGDIVSPNQFGPPTGHLDDGGNNPPPQEFHRTGPGADNDEVMEDIIGGDAKKQ